MATITLTGTSDQLRRVAAAIEAAADASTNPRSVTVTLDNGVSGAAAAVTDSTGKRRDG